MIAPTKQDRHRELDVLNLGCGRKPMQNALNVDIAGPGDLGASGVDICHDLDRRPWPLPDGRFREIHLYDVLEHLNDVVASLGEIHRVARPGARVFLTVPHFSCRNAFTDPTHKQFFGAASFDYFSDEHELSFYSRCRFRKVRCEIVFQRSWLSPLVRRLANRFPAAYELRWAWIFPAWFLSVELEVVKE